MSLTKDDDDLKIATGNNFYNQKQTYKHEKPTFTYSNVCEIVPGVYNRPQAFGTEVQVSLLFVRALTS